MRYLNFRFGALSLGLWFVLAAGQGWAAADLQEEPPNPTEPIELGTNAIGSLEMEEGATNELAAVPLPVVPALTGEDLTNALATATEQLENRMMPAVEAVDLKLQLLEQMIQSQYVRSVEAGYQSTKTMLWAAACFAVAVLLGILIASLILARAIQRVSDGVIHALPGLRALPAGSVVGGLGAGGGGELAAGGNGSVSIAPVEQVTERFLNAIDQLERRLLEVERATHAGAPEIPAGSSTTTNTQPLGSGGSASAMEFSVRALAEKQYSPAESAGPGDTVSVLLGKGQALLNLGRAEEALGCFDEAVRLSPANADAHVRRGMALERLQQLDQALESYDRAIAANGSLTLAWLYKGAVCNRLQRFREALECYENALKSEQRQAS